MKITKELLLNLIKEELKKKNKEVRELDVIPGRTQKSHKVDENHKIVCSKRVNTTTNKVTYIVGLVEGTGKDEGITEYNKEYKEEAEANKFYDSLKNLNVKEIKKAFDNKSK